MLLFYHVFKKIHISKKIKKDTYYTELFNYIRNEQDRTRKTLYCCRLLMKVVKKTFGVVSGTAKGNNDGLLQKKSADHYSYPTRECRIKEVEVCMLLGAKCDNFRCYNVI